MNNLDCMYFTVDFHTSFNGVKGKVSFEVSEPIEISFDYDDESGDLRANYNGEQLEFLDEISYEFGGTFAYIKIIHKEQDSTFTKTKYQCVILGGLNKFFEWTMQDVLIEIHRQHGLSYIVSEDD